MGKKDIKNLLASDTNGITSIKKTAKEVALLESLLAVNQNSGFNREDSTTMGKIEFCNSASTETYYQIDEDSVYTLVTGVTTFSDGTALADRTVAHIVTSATYYLIDGGLVYPTTTQTLQIDDDDDEHFIAYNHDGDLYSVTDASYAIRREVLLSIITRHSGDNDLTWFADERHGIMQDGQTHLQRHLASGFDWHMGYDLNGITVNTDASFTSIDWGSGFDEDIATTMYLSATTCPTLYKKGTGWKLDFDNEYFGTTDDGGGSYKYNPITAGSGALATYAGDYAVTTFCICNNKLGPIFKIPSQEEYAGRGDARDAADSLWYQLESDGLPSPEVKPIYSFIINSSGKIINGGDGETYIDMRHKQDIKLYL